MSVHRLLAATAILATAASGGVLAAAFTFGPYRQYAVPNDGAREVPVSAGDVTGDGRTDALLITRNAVTGRDQLFLLMQSSAGTLGSPKMIFDCACTLTPPQTGDIDGDGISDIVVGYDNGLTVLRALGNAQFSAQRYDADRPTLALALADFNNDNLLDIARTKGIMPGPNGVEIWSGVTYGGFSVQGGFWIHSATAPLALRVGDVDGASVVSWPDPVFGGPDKVYVAVNVSDWLDASEDYPGPSGVVMGAMQIADLNADGRSDVITANRARSPVSQFWMFPNDGAGKLGTPRPLPGSGVPDALASADLDRNGYEDLVSLGGYGLGRIMHGASGLAPEVVGVIPSSPAYGGDSLAAADIDGDGCTDAITGDRARGLLVVPGVNCYEPWSMSNHFAGDFDGNGQSDILWHNSATGASTIWKGGVSANQVLLTVTDTQWKIVGIGDFNGDGKSDVLRRHTFLGYNVIWYSGNSATAVTLKGVRDNRWSVVGIGDFSGNGRDDLLWRNSQTGENVVWPDAQAANVRFLTAVTDKDWLVVGVGDFDGNGKDDILWRRRSDGRNAIWGDANSQTQQAVGRFSDLGWQVAGLGDFDQDGRADILWRHSFYGRTSIWHNASSTETRVLTQITDLTWKIAGVGDYDADGRSDILWRRSNSGANVIWRGADYSAPQSVSGVTNMQWGIIR